MAVTIGAVMNLTVRPLADAPTESMWMLADLASDSTRR